MPARYFAATDGTITLFRASPTRVYLSACLVRGGGTFGSFSGKGQTGHGWFACRELAKPEYEALVAAKKRRTADSAPDASWVYNADLVASASSAKAA